MKNKHNSFDVCLCVCWVERAKYELSQESKDNVTFIKLKNEEYIQKASGYYITLISGAVGFLVDTLEIARYLGLSESEYVERRKSAYDDYRLALIGGALVDIPPKNYDVLTKKPGFVVGEIIK